MFQAVCELEPQQLIGWSQPLSSPKTKGLNKDINEIIRNWEECHEKEKQGYGIENNCGSPLGWVALHASEKWSYEPKANG